MPTHLLLIRHGQSTWNAEGRWQGWSDAPLTALGRTQAAEAAERLRGLGLSTVRASDLDRAGTTAAILGEALALGTVVIDDGLREYNVGAWEGLTRPEIEYGWPDHLDAWRKGRLMATPGGETRVHFLDRVRAAMVRVAAPGPMPDAGFVSDAGPPGDADYGEKVLVVTHGGVIRAAEQLAGTARMAVIDNLSGRWFTVGADGGIYAGEVLKTLQSPIRTSSPSL